MSSPNIDWQTTQVNLPGISTPIYARYEYTSSDVSNAFNAYIGMIAEVFKKQADPTANPPTTIGSDEVNQVNFAMQQLYALAQNGIVDQSTGKTWYLNTEMASSLDSLARTFMATGFPIPGQANFPFPGQPGMPVYDFNTQTLTSTPATSDQVQALQTWKDLSILSPIVTQILQVGIDAYSTNRTLQALIELEYVKNANDLIDSKMQELEQALGLTQGILNTLSAVQTLHNKILISAKPAIDFNYLSAHSPNYVSAYINVASGYFGGPISARVPNIGTVQYKYISMVQHTSITSDLFGFRGYKSAFLGYQAVVTNVVLNSLGKTYIDDLIKYRASIAAQISNLSKILTESQKNGTGGIFLSLQGVLKDVDATFTANGQPITEGSTDTDKYKGFASWLIDNYNTPNSSEAGVYQQNITKAITAGESLNDSQKTDVRNYLFVFEEYYKSASAILQKISQIIEKMGQGIRS